MTTLQHQGALKLLQIIEKQHPNKSPPTYAEAALLLGRPRSHARAVAQMCDLLDAAAAAAGIPLLALVAIHENSHQINRKAWKRETTPAAREEIIQRSLNHAFTSEDFQAIREGLGELDSRGNRAAWKYLTFVFGKHQLLARVRGLGAHLRDVAAERPDQEEEAIEGDRRLIAHYRRERNPILARKKKDAARGRSGGLKCECCGKDSRETFPSIEADLWEVHHRKPLSQAKQSVRTTLADLAVLCPTCHRAIHRTKPMMQVTAFARTFFGQKPASHNRQ